MCNAAAAGGLISLKADPPASARGGRAKTHGSKAMGQNQWGKTTGAKLLGQNYWAKLHEPNFMGQTSWAKPHGRARHPRQQRLHRTSAARCRQWLTRVEAVAM